MQRGGTCQSASRILGLCTTLLGARGQEWILWLTNWKVLPPGTGVPKTSPWGALLWGQECEGPGSLLYSFFAELSDLGDASHL